MSRCGDFLSWWDGEYEAWCELDRDHAGDHSDGGIWWDDEGNDRSVDHP